MGISTLTWRLLSARSVPALKVYAAEMAPSAARLKEATPVARPPPGMVSVKSLELPWGSGAPTPTAPA
jgi:hypothetical protein